MNVTTRAAIALLAGVGAGTLGFWMVWESVRSLLGVDPGLNHDAWLLAGIFLPGVAVPLLVFRAVSATRRSDGPTLARPPA